MNDLRNGIIDINGFLLTPTTTLEELENHFGIQGVRSERHSWLVIDKAEVVCNEMSFHLEVSYRNSAPDKVWQVELTPIIPELIEKYDVSEHNCPRDYYNDLLPYYRDVRTVLEKWLYEQLGEPTRNNEKNTTYDYGTFYINTCAYIDERNPHDDFDVHGGKLLINFYG